MQCYCAVRSQIFRLRHAGRWYLVASRSRGWHEFIVNNVLPALPDHTSCVWVRPVRGQAATWRKPDVLCMLGRRSVNLSKPYLVIVRRNRCVIVPLHDWLIGLKGRRRKDAAVQRAVAGILANVVADVGYRRNAGAAQGS